MLGPDRPVYMGGVGHIPVPSIVAYAAIADLDPLELLARMRACDVVFLEWWDERRKETEAREKRKARGSKPNAGPQRQKHR